MKINGWELIKDEAKEKIFKKGNQEVWYKKFRIGIYVAGVRKVGDSKSNVSLTFPLGQNIRKETEVFKIIKSYMLAH